MKNITKNIVLFAVAAFALVSCDMDLTPKTSIVYKEGEPIFTKESDITSFENGILTYYRSIQGGEFALASEFMCDGFNAARGYGNNYGGIHRTDASFNASDYYIEDFWAYNYFAIKNYNIVISNAEITSGDLLAKAKIVKGEAHLLRACSYLQLARHFGKAYNPTTADTDLCVPLVLVYDQNEKPSRATVQAVYTAIKNDLDAAAELLAGVSGKAAAQKPTIDVVNAVMARYYLDTKQYDKAAETAAALVNSGVYALSTTAEEIAIQYSGDGGEESGSKEAIFQMYASLSELPTSYNLELTGFAKDSNNESGFSYTPYFLPSGKLVDSYDPTDIRLNGWFEDGTIYPVRLESIYYEGDFKVFTKYKGNKALNSSGYPNGRQAIKPFLISEQYLIAAEAYAQNNDPVNAKTYLNALQAKRGAIPTDATIANIQKEWFRETPGEGLRMSCLKRWGLGFDNRIAQAGASTNHAVMEGNDYANKTMTANDYHFCWPIPTYDIKINKNLEQNPGYSAVE